MSASLSSEIEDVENSCTSISSISNEHESNSESVATREYSVQQINIEPGGQVLDCKVGRDEQTGLPRVEMVFSLNPDITGAGGTGGDFLIANNSSVTGIRDDLDVCIDCTVVGIMIALHSTLFNVSQLTSLCVHV